MYGVGVVIRNWMFDAGILKSYSAGVPVISVGNLTVGGTGKTPIVEYVVNRLLGANYKVAVLSRGYKRRSKGTVVVSDGAAVLADVQESGDEPLQIARKFPSAVVVVDEDRVRGAKKAVEQYRVQVVVLDDGFQHRRIRRDLDILVVDVERPPYAEWLLPAGTRREPMSGIKRADTIVLSRSLPDRDSRVRERLSRLSKKPQLGVQFLPKVLVRLTDGSTLQPRDIRNKSCFAFCGIARPEVFERSVREMGVHVNGFRAFPDHYQYSETDMESLLRGSKQVFPDLWITTEKDAVRLMNQGMKQILDSVPLYYLELETRFNDSVTFSDLLQKTVSQYKHARSSYR